ncbi:MAG TPA: methyltransferase domain-containing protein [Propionibacteriaceae bacterium]|nr:methyltransferase domain-containing protein [Propionibacteriaceae bacterium]
MYYGNAKSVRGAVHAAGLEPGQTVADLGFGGGLGLAELLASVGASGHVYGIDASQTMVDAARRRFRHEATQGHLTIRRGDLTALPLGDAMLDASFVVNTLYFVDDLTPVFAELLRITRAGGVVVIGVADPAALAALPFTAHGFITRTPDEVNHYLTEAGFTGLRHERLGHDAGAFHLLVAQRPLLASA